MHQVREEANEAVEAYNFFTKNKLTTSSEIIEIVEDTKMRKIANGKGSSSTSLHHFPKGCHSMTFRLNKIAVKDGSGLFFIMKAGPVTFSF